jgi:hypothetical protein
MEYFMYYLGKGIQDDRIQSFDAKDLSSFEEDVTELCARHTKDQENIVAGFNEFKDACHRFCVINKDHIDSSIDAIKNNDINKAIIVLNENFGEMSSFPDASVRMKVRADYGDNVMGVVREMLDNLNRMSFKVYEQRDEIVKKLKNDNPDFNVIFSDLNTIKEELCY